MPAKPLVCAVSYLNTSPLVWGMAHGPQRSLVDLQSATPAECADRLERGEADVGLLPIVELARQPGMSVAPRGCIACRGEVRSILLVSKKPFARVESIAVDRGSRTSSVLAQTLALELHGTKPSIQSHAPQLDEMLRESDAALIIGDPALRLDPKMSDWRGKAVYSYDLGAEWLSLTGLPMVFAVWAARSADGAPGLVTTLAESAAFGLERVEEIVTAESARLELPADLVRRYLTHHIRYDLGPAEREGIDTFLSMAARQGLVEPAEAVRYLPDPAESEALAVPSERGA